MHAIQFRVLKYPCQQRDVSYEKLFIFHVANSLKWSAQLRYTRRVDQDILPIGKKELDQ